MIKEKSIPKFVFHYSKMSKHLYESLITSELWFASPNSFNDPFDCQYDDQTEWDDDSVRDFVREKIKISGEYIDPEIVVRKFQQDPISFTDFVSNQVNDYMKTIGVFCCASSSRNRLMWSHYTNSHQGVCLKFDITKDKDLFENTNRVIYSMKYPIFNNMHSKKESYDYANRVLIKSKHWKYENEIRTIKLRSGYYRFNKECLKEIIFGLNSDDKEIKTLKQIIKINYNKNRTNIQKVKFKKVQFKKYSYQIEFKKI